MVKVSLQGTAARGWMACVAWLMALVCGVAGAATGRSVEDFTSALHWAPLHIKKPYMTFLNDFHQPTWRTRHPITKLPEPLTHLTLPRGVPFSIICGACFGRSNADTNLTVSLGQHKTHVVRKHRSGDRYEYNVNHIECLMTYAVTEPLHSADTVTCTLTRGRHVMHEHLTFSMTEVAVEAPPEQLSGEAEGDVVQLACPEPQVAATLANPVVAVWHEAATPNHHLTAPLATMQPRITLARPRLPREVVCSVYHISQPHRVYQTHYRIPGTIVAAKKDFRLGGGERLELEEDAEMVVPAPSGLPSSVLGLIGAGVAVVVLISAIGVYRLLVAAKR